MPSSTLAPKITKPEGIKGRSVAVEINKNDMTALIEKVLGEVGK
jgi:hypothetical protein